jgi:predicted Zn-dependent protease
MPRKPDEYAVHLLLSSSHREEVRFTTIQEFQKWFTGELVPKAESKDFITVPIKNIQGEYMVAIRVEPIFFGSVERVESDE